MALRWAADADPDGVIGHDEVVCQLLALGVRDLDGQLLLLGVGQHSPRRGSQRGPSSASYGTLGLMAVAGPDTTAKYVREQETDPLIRAHVAERGQGVDKPVIEDTPYTVAAVWQAFQRVRGDRRGFRIRTPDLTEDQRMAAIRFVGKYPQYVAPQQSPMHADRPSC